MAIQESGEMYLETIRILQEKTGHVRSTDIAEHMGFSKPSVNRAVGLLKKGEFITVEKEGYIHLTEKGLAVAEKILERHTILTQSDTFGHIAALGAEHQLVIAVHNAFHIHKQGQITAADVAGKGRFFQGQGIAANDDIVGFLTGQVD